MQAYLAYLGILCICRYIQTYSASLKYIHKYGRIIKAYSGLSET